MLKNLNKWQTRKLDAIVSNNNYKAVQLNQADSTFDNLWDKTKNYYMLSNVRTADVLNWYLKLNQTSIKSLYGCYNSGNLIGYMLMADCKIRNVALKYCFDLWFLKGHEHGITSILHHIAKQNSEKEYGAIVVPHFNKTISNYLSRIGLLKIKGKKLMNFIAAPDEIMEKIRSDNCYIVYIQSDRGIS